MKSQERELFEIILKTYPKFLNQVHWEEGPDPPDVIITDGSGRKVGVELTEWLNPDQTTRSITIQENEIQWLLALNTEQYDVPKHFCPVQIRFRADVRFSKHELDLFRKEFYELVEYLDRHWIELFAGTPQTLWNDFTEYPTLRRRVQSFWLHRNPVMRVNKGARWVVSEAKGGAYDPYWATHALLARIQSKTSKPEYASLKNDLKLDEFVLLLHYGLRGLLHNTPFEGVNRTLEHVLEDVRAFLSTQSGPFDRVFLYFAYNEGQMEQLYPSSLPPEQEE